MDRARRPSAKLLERPDWSDGKIRQMSPNAGQITIHKYPFLHRCGFIVCVFVLQYCVVSPALNDMAAQVPALCAHRKPVFRDQFADVNLHLPIHRPVVCSRVAFCPTPISIWFGMHVDLVPSPQNYQYLVV